MHRHFSCLKVITLLIMCTSFLWSMMSLTITKPVGWQALPEKIYKDQNDPRLYQAIKLDNGMQVILVSDKNATKSLAALALPVGSLDDPNSQLGLAHYLEHLVLMGSKRYPKVDDFSEFLQKHGGRHNASTASYRTAFYLEVENDALSPAVDRLADAIAAPLLDRVIADHELNAVNAELTMARSCDAMRMAQVSAETLNPLHPSARFSGGNTETLRNKPYSNLQQERLLFYHRYYSSNLMVSVIYGNQPISKLAEIACISFGRIANRHAIVPPITVPVVTPEQQGIIIHYVPAKPCKILKIEYRIDNNSALFRSKTDEYIAYLIINRSKNTLSDWLKKQGLVESIDAGSDPMVDRNGGVFCISIELTNKGLAERDLVISAVYSYLKLIRNQGVRESYFNEIAHVLDIDFRYPSIIRDMDYIEWLVDNMLRVPIKDSLNSLYVADKYDPHAIELRLNSMIPNNARIWIISPDEPYDKVAYFLNAQYQVDRITAKQFRYWGNLAKNILLSLPTLNPYIPNDFTLNKSDLPRMMKPEMVLDEQTLRALYMHSIHFPNEPRADITISLRNKIGDASVKEHVMFLLMDYIAGIALDHLVYQASIGGIVFYTTYNCGLTINASGFTQFLPALLTRLINIYIDFEINEKYLVQAKAWYLGQLNSAETVKAFEQAMQPIQSLSSIPCADISERRALLDQITIIDIKNYRTQLIKGAAPELLVVGNMTAMQVQVMSQNIRAQLKSAGMLWWHGQNVVLNHKQLANIQYKGSSTDSALGAVYIPVGYDEVEGMACSQLLSHIIQPWFYDQLRTKEQLGYAVFAYPASIGNQWGIGFLLQSNSQSPSYLYKRYLDFYRKADKLLESLKESDFKQYKLALINKLKQRPQNLSEEASRFSNDFDRGNFKFNTRDNLIKQINALSSDNFITFYHKAVMQPQGMALLSQVLGSHTQGYYAAPKGWITYKNVSALQHTLSFKVCPS
ncbi:pitrilysin [Candidatus Profftia tarda]